MANTHTNSVTLQTRKNFLKVVRISRGCETWTVSAMDVVLSTDVENKMDISSEK